MAFHEIERGEFGGKPALSGAVKAHSSDKGNTITIAIAGDIFHKLGDPMFLNVLLGSGEHSGFMALIPRNTRGAASYKPSFQASKKTPRLSIHPNKIGVVSRVVPPTFLPHEITSDGLIVDIRPLRQPSIVAAAA